MANLRLLAAIVAEGRGRKLRYRVIDADWGLSAAAQFEIAMAFRADVVKPAPVK